MLSDLAHVRKLSTMVLDMLPEAIYMGVINGTKKVDLVSYHEPPGDDCNISNVCR